MVIKNENSCDWNCNLYHTLLQIWLSYQKIIVQIYEQEMKSVIKYFKLNLKCSPG